MTVGEIILGLVIVILAFVLGLVAIVTKWDTEQLEKENAKLKEDLKKARARKVKSEYKKNEIKGEEK